MSILGTVMAPEAGNQIPSPSPAIAACGRRISRAYGASYQHRIVEELETTGPSSIWQLVNRLARQDEPDGRESERDFRVRYLGGLKGLLRAGKVRRVHRKLVCLPGQEEAAREQFAALQHEQATRSGCRAGVKDSERQYIPADMSGVTAQAVKTDENQGRPEKVPDFAGRAVHHQIKSVEAQAGAASTPMATTTLCPAPTNEPKPDPQQVSQAGRILRSMPRKVSKQWTGFLCGARCWRGRLLLLPDGEIAPLLWCNRGRVLLLNYRDKDFNDYLLWARRHEEEVRLYRCPEAALLGSLKFGVKERPSALKAAAARRNGLLPPRPGSRPRGHPRAGNIQISVSE